MQYLSFRISRRQFIKTYKGSIISLVERGTYDDILFDEKGECVYTNIIKVYDKITKNKKVEVFQRVLRILIGIIVIMSVLCGVFEWRSWGWVATFDTIVGFTGYGLDGLIESIKKYNTC